MIKTYNGRFVPKGDTEANWNKAVGFIPLDKEIIIYKADSTHPAARFKVGDGKTVVQELPFSGTDIEAITKLIDEKGEILIEYVDNAVAAIPEIQDKIAELEGRVTIITFDVTKQSEWERTAFTDITGATKIDWGDGTVNLEKEHIYAVPGVYTCKIYDVVSLSSDLSSVYSNPIISIQLGSTIKNIPNNAFGWNTHLQSVVINSNHITSIPSHAFYYCSSLTNIQIPDGVKSIGTYAFFSCSSLTSVEIPDSVTSIDNNAFRGCSSLTSVVIGDSVTSIDYYAFRDCDSLTSVIIGDGVTSIDNGAFRNCTCLTNVTIPDSVTTIDSYAFSGCGLIGDITISDKVIRLSDDAFKCDQLTSITLKLKNPPHFGSYTGVMSGNFQTIYVPYGCGAAYRIKWSENHAPQEVLRKIKESDREAMMSDLKTITKDSLINSTETWTDEEKAKACETIGALKAITNAYGENIFRVYCIDNQGNQQIIRTTDNTNVLASKKYAEDNFVARNTYASNIVYGKEGGVEKVYDVSVSPVGSTIVRRGTDGNVAVTYPNNGSSATSKAYVDGKTDALSQDISVINLTLEQSGLLKKYKQPITQEYNERVTADGANVLDGSKAKLKKVVGNTVACKNFFNPFVLSVQAETDTNWIKSVTSSEIVIGVKKGYVVNTGKTLQDFCPALKIGQTVWLNGESTGYGAINLSGTISTAWLPGKSITITKEYLTATVSIPLNADGSAGDVTITNLRITENQNEPFTPYFTGLKSASFAGLESTNADGTETSTLAFPKTHTPLGVTIDFENKKITNTHADYTFTGNEGWGKGSSSPSGFERWYCSIPNMASGLSSNDFNYGVCDKYSTIFNVNEYYATKKEGVIFGFGVGNNYFQFVASEGQTEQSIRELTKGMKVRYPLDPAYHKSTDFTADNEYTAYKGGTEKVLDNDGNEYRADNTLTQDYILVTEV